MGLPISPTVANLFMEEFETKAINSTQTYQGCGLGLLVTPFYLKGRIQPPVPTAHQLK